jgi:CRP/FNR family cyclic AMP-dependent transcriptional regulator
VSDGAHVRSVLGGSAHFRTIPAEVLDRLAALAKVERFRHGELVHPAWQRSDRFWVVMKGGLRCTVHATDGSATTVAVFGKGSYFGAGALTDDTRDPVEVHAISPTELAAWDMADLQPLIEGNEEAQRFLRTLIYRRVLAAATLYRDAVAAPLLERIARRLLSQALAAGCWEPSAATTLHLSQQDLATMVGASRTSVSEELQKLERHAIVRLGYRTVVVRDLLGLLKLAGTDVFPL